MSSKMNSIDNKLATLTTGQSTLKTELTKELAALKTDVKSLDTKVEELRKDFNKKFDAVNLQLADIKKDQSSLVVQLPWAEAFKPGEFLQSHTTSRIPQSDPTKNQIKESQVWRLGAGRCVEKSSFVSDFLEENLKAM